MALSDPMLIWLCTVFAYGLSRIGEWRIHQFNYQYLRSIGAEELIPGRMRRYYNFVFLLLPVAASEHLLFSQPIFKEMLVGGILLVGFGLWLRLWSIRSLGRLWSMRCLGVVGAPIVRTGPYRYASNPEYVSRVVDALGLFLMIGARWTALFYLIWLLYILPDIVSVETRQLRELGQSNSHRRLSLRPRSPGPRPLVR